MQIKSPKNPDDLLKSPLIRPLVLLIRVIYKCFCFTFRKGGIKGNNFVKVVLVYDLLRVHHEIFVATSVYCFP